ncbi:MAG: endonuclease/exonuclease/phosphatase family protein [Pseudomonadota bacterium]|nr:MAG: endonuclease/exonuclease/phosphatase family protein [Pseudomonadota bacterium]
MLRTVPRKIIAVVVPAFAAMVTATLFGCVTIPTDHRTLHGDARGFVRVASAPCAQATAALDRETVPTLDAERLRVLTWNIHRASHPNWREDFTKFARDHDVLALQEAYLTDDLYGALWDQRYHWRLTAAFQLFNVDAGVLTASRAPAYRTCSLRRAEPWLRVPKSALATSYRIAGLNESLLVANLHGVNFTIGITAFREQVEAVASVIADHRGPVVLAGDFNTWSEARRLLLESTVARLGLEPVRLADDHRTRFLGEPVDGMYYRGLEVTAAVAHPVTSSDHNPISVTFRAPTATVVAQRL